jgi:hypothetical protein
MLPSTSQDTLALHFNMIRFSLYGDRLIAMAQLSMGLPTKEVDVFFFVFNNTCSAVPSLYSNLHYALMALLILP